MTSRRIILLFIILEGFIVAGAIFSDGFSISALQTITRFSGRLCLLLFSAIFFLYNKPNIIQVWLSEKYYLLFAIVNGIHLTEYLILLSNVNTPLIYYRVVGGIIAYTFIFSMPFIRNYFIAGKISVEKYFIIETVFIYLIWLVFFLTYLPRVQGKLPTFEGSYTESIAILGWVSTMLGIKLTSMVQFKKVR